jgi:hypothetical protein
MNDIIAGIVVISAGSLINFISTKIYNYFTGESKNFFWANEIKNLKNQNYSDNFNDLKKRTKIVVIDDEDGFPIKLFKNEGYTIEKWGKVEDYAKLENGFFDIIILDIKGVARHISEDDGLGVLVNLKKKNPAQIIISYSQHSYDLNKIQFFQQADENIAKPSDFLKIKNIIDNLILTQFKPERYIKALNQTLRNHNISEKEITKLNHKISKIITTNSKPKWEKLLSFIDDRIELQKQVITLGETIIKFYYQ